jgi:hypothetical protein
VGFNWIVGKICGWNVRNFQWKRIGNMYVAGALGTFRRANGKYQNGIREWRKTNRDLSKKMHA